MPADRKGWWPGVGSVEAVAPGIYVDGAGNLHVETGEVLRYLGADDTPDGRRLVARTFTAEVSHVLPGKVAAIRAREALNAG